MANNKYVACISCGMVYDTEEYYYIFEEENCYIPCGCSVHFYIDDKDFAYCGKNEEEGEEDKKIENLETKIQELKSDLKILENSVRWLKTFFNI